MGRAEDRQRLKSQKKKFKKMGMTDKHYEDFKKQVDDRYYADIVNQAYQDVYNIYTKKLIEIMKNNRISEERANKIIASSLEAMKGEQLTHVRVVDGGFKNE